MLFNPEIKYKSRIYQEFNCAIKKIKLRDSLSDIIAAPDIYMRTKVSADMFDTLQKFAEIRKLDRQTLVRDFNLYPSAENLITLERKYGDSISLYDLNGTKQKKHRKHRGETTATATDIRTETTSLETKTKLSHENTESVTVRSATAGNPHKHTKDEESEDSEE